MSKPETSAPTRNRDEISSSSPLLKFYGKWLLEERGDENKTDTLY